MSTAGLLKLLLTLQAVGQGRAQTEIHVLSRDPKQSQILEDAANGRTSPRVRLPTYRDRLRLLDELPQVAMLAKQKKWDGFAIDMFFFRAAQINASEMDWRTKYPELAFEDLRKIWFSCSRQLSDQNWNARQ